MFTAKYNVHAILVENDMSRELYCMFVFLDVLTTVQLSSAKCQYSKESCLAVHRFSSKQMCKTIVSDSFLRREFKIINYWILQNIVRVLKQFNIHNSKQKNIPFRCNLYFCGRVIFLW